MNRVVPRLRKGSYANVASTLALVLALGGTSYAAVVLQNGQVKTRHIANGAVTSAKIQNSGVAPLDLKPAAKQRVWSSVKIFPGGGGTPITGSFSTFHTLNVPAGKYLVTAAAEFTSNAGQLNAAICDVVSPGVAGVPRYVVGLADDETGTLGGQAIITRTTAGTISMRCFDNSGVVDGLARRDSSLTALKVHTVVSSAPTP